MVDVSDKTISKREACASGTISMQPKTFDMIVKKEIRKGDVLEVARVAGIMGTKQTSALIPMCHPLPISSVAIHYRCHEKTAAIDIEATVRVTGKTGVEMEALTAVSITALTIYDMCKAVDRGMSISDIRLLRKSGGKSGVFQAP